MIQRNYRGGGRQYTKHYIHIVCTSPITFFFDANATVLLRQPDEKGWRGRVVWVVYVWWKGRIWWKWKESIQLRQGFIIQPPLRIACWATMYSYSSKLIKSLSLTCKKQKDYPLPTSHPVSHTHTHTYVKISTGLKVRKTQSLLPLVCLSVCQHCFFYSVSSICDPHSELYKVMKSSIYIFFLVGTTGICVGKGWGCDRESQGLLQLH